MIIKNLGILFIIFIIFVINLAAQSSSDTTISGILNKSTADSKYSIDGIEIKLPDDKKDSYNFYFDPYIGQEIKFRGKSINAKLIEGDDIWYGNDSKPTAADFPQISQTGKSIEEFIPKNWVVLQQSIGDLNNDNQDDVVLAIRGNDLKFFRFTHDIRGKIQSLTNPITGVTHFGSDGNPRILIVLLKSPNGYDLILQNNSFLPISVFGMGESLTKVAIKNGDLTIDFNYGDPHWGFIEKNFSQLIVSDLIINGNFQIIDYCFSWRKSYPFTLTVNFTIFKIDGRIDLRNE